MILSDVSIEHELKVGRLVIEPPPSIIQPASVDVHLGPIFRKFRQHTYYFIDPRQRQDGLTFIPDTENEPFVFRPAEFMLAETMECITLPDNVVARVEGKSSLGRLGLQVHITAGYIDPGWHGTITLELKNQNTLPILLYPGMKIAQLSFDYTSTPVRRPYGSEGLGSKYAGQVGPTESRAYEDFDNG